MENLPEGPLESPDVENVPAVKERPDYEVAKDEIQELMEKHKLVTKSEFVPRSQSRDPKAEMVNWKVTLCRYKEKKPESSVQPDTIFRKRDGAYVGITELITTDYSQGIAHLKGYKHFAKKTTDYVTELANVLETGRSKFGWSSYNFTPKVPTDVDIIAALANDSDVLDYSDYEEWASNCGFEPDSRKGEKIYKACLKIALKMRSSLGDALLTEFRELARRL